MEVPTTGSTFSEKDNKIDLVINSSSPKFEDLIDIKNYNITNIPKKNSKKQVLQMLLHINQGLSN